MAEEKKYTVELTSNEASIVLGLMHYSINEFGSDIDKLPLNELASNVSLFKRMADLYNRIAKECEQERTINVTILGV